MNFEFERTIRGAREAALAGLTDEWVNVFLSSGVGANVPMAIGLRKQQRWWIGPVRVPLASLTRICGPEPEMEYFSAVEHWEPHVAEIMSVDVDHLPPLILEFRGAAPLGLHDGSHRHEALRRRGESQAWALIWCNSEADYVIARQQYCAATE
jgi:hypothetical protein